MATGRTLILLLPLAVCLAMLSGQTCANPRAQSDACLSEGGNAQRLMGPGRFSRVGEASRGNYTISFVPLFSVLANFFPRLLNRFSPQTQRARSQAISAGVMEATCNEVHPHKLWWPDPKNRQQFLFCYLDPDCVALFQKSGVNTTYSELRCYSLRTEKCPAKTVFDFHQQQCVYK